MTIYHIFLLYQTPSSSYATAVGTPISEEDQMVTLLGSLPSNYATLVTALEARVDDLILEFVHQSLIHEE